MTDRQCSVEITPYIGNWPQKPRNCRRKGTVEVDGEWYCAQHDPQAIVRKAEEREAEYQRKWRVRRIERYGPRFYAVLREIAEGHNDPRTLAIETLKEIDE